MQRLALFTDTVTPFADKYRVDPDTGCWLWTGAITASTGYGKVKVNGKAVDAHRAMYVAYRGAVPDGMQLDHLCRTRACVYPQHMEPVTQLENIRRGLAFRGPRAACRRGHPMDGDNLQIAANGERRCVVCRRRSYADKNARRVLEGEAAA